MAIFLGTQLIDSDGFVLKDNLGQVILAEPHTESFYPDYTNFDIERAVRSFISVPIFKIELLNRDETVREDLSQFVIESSINYSQSFQSGKTRSLKFDLYDENGAYFPSHIGKIWYGSKVRLSMGLLVGNTVLFFPKGIFMVENASYSQKIISLQFTDKFGNLDGTISGITESYYQISPNTPIIEAIQTLLALDDGFGVYDTKRIIFPTGYENAVVPYTIKNDYENSVGNIIIELAEIISCRVFYDDYGYLTFETSNEITDLSAKIIDWSYIDGECQFYDTNMDIKFPDVYNKIMVVGSNINGYLCQYTATNDLASSPTSIKNSPVRFKYIEDSNIYSDELCQTRAEYELQLATLLSVPISFKSVYIPFLSVNNLIEYTNNTILYGAYGNRVFEKEKLLITSIDVSGNGNIDVAAKNIKELPFYG